MLDMGKVKKTIIYVLIIILQILVILYWTNKKTGYHIDELYSMGYASNLTGRGDCALYITTGSEFGFDKWIKNADLKKYLELSKEESIFNAPISEVIRGFITTRNYTYLLNIAESLLGDGTVSAKPAVYLNIVLFAIAEAFFAVLMKRVSIDERIRYLALIMFGFSGYMISMAVYVRFYMLVVMLAFMMLNCFYSLWIADTWKQTFMPIVLIMILAYLSLRNSEFTVPFFAAFIGCFIIACLIEKKRKQLLISLAVCICGFIYIVATTDFLGILLFPDKYSNVSVVWLSAGLSFRKITAGGLWEYFSWLIELLETHFFGARSIVYGLAGAITICFIISSERDNNIMSFDINRLRPVTLCALVLWIALTGLSIITGHGRIICVIILLIVVLLCVGEMIGVKLRLRKPDLSSNTVFVLVLVGEAVIYTVFCAICLYSVWRYFCFAYISGTLAFWYVIDRLFKKREIEFVRRPLMTIMVTFVVINALLPFVTRNIECIYEDEKEFKERIRANQNLDVVMILPVTEETIAIERIGYLSRHSIYDCVNTMPRSANILVSSLDEYTYDKVDYPDEFLLWTQEYQENMDLTEVLRDLKKNGYSVEEIGTNHDSDVYIVRANGAM